MGIRRRHFRQAMDNLPDEQSVHAVQTQKKFVLLASEKAVFNYSKASQEEIGNWGNWKLATSQIEIPTSQVSQFSNFSISNFPQKPLSNIKLNLDLSAQAVLKRKPASSSVEALNELIIDSIQDIKGKNIVKLDLRKLHDAPTDFFIICEGDSNTQVKALADNIAKRARLELGQGPLHVEGSQNARWICLDFFFTVVHVFYRETRKFYELEDLWSDAEFVEYANL